jgi:hypothetical protein
MKFKLHKKKKDFKTALDIQKDYNNIPEKIGSEVKKFLRQEFKDEDTKIKLGDKRDVSYAQFYTLVAGFNEE